MGVREDPGGRRASRASCFILREILPLNKFLHSSDVILNSVHRSRKFPRGERCTHTSLTVSDHPVCLDKEVRKLVDGSFIHAILRHCRVDVIEHVVDWG